MKGIVEIGNVTKGNNFIRGEDGQRYFGHETDIQQVVGLRCLLPGCEVTFNPVRGDKGLVAKKIVPTSEVGLTRNEVDPFGLEEDKPEIPLHIDALGRIRVGERVLIPATTGKNAQAAFRAYYVGTHTFRGFDLALPVARSESAFALLDRNKNPRRPRTGGHYAAEVGTYLVKVSADGQVVVWNLGVRVQSGVHRWIVIERRFVHHYDLSECSEKSLLDQTPTSGMEKRDNDGFVRGILAAVESLREAQCSATTAA
jgi:cold shock CspA family protein